MKARVRLFALTLVLVLFLAAISRPTSATVSPNGSYCLDEAGVLSERTIDFITERNHNLEANCSGAQICVVALKSIGNDLIEDKARSIFEKWEIGRAGEDNGALILIVTEDRSYTIVPGRGLEKTLNVSVLTDIYRNRIEPFFEDGDYDSAVRDAFTKLNEIICDKYKADPSGFAGGGGFVGGGSGRPGAAHGLNGSSCPDFSFSCGDIGSISFAACSACVVLDLLSTSGGN